MYYYVFGNFTYDYKYSEDCDCEAEGKIVEGAAEAKLLQNEWKKLSKYESVGIIPLISK